MAGQYLFFVYPVRIAVDTSRDHSVLIDIIFIIGMVSSLFYDITVAPVSFPIRFIYGGIGMAVFAVAVINAISLSNVWLKISAF
jgi:hypothetical protein